ncbi:unnamed protein product [Discula destructiva]
MPAPVDTLGHAALDFVKDDRMNREFTLPATATHDALNVSFADVGRLPEPPLAASSADLPTVLFIPGMFASRYIGPHLHDIADKLGVRVLVVDRPGMGRSTDVPLAQRISIWVELVPSLLQHLGVERVSLVSHSAGTMFLLNTLHHCRNLIDPDRPFVALLAPFADPTHSKVKALQAARFIPASVFGIWNILPKFSVLQAKPALAFSAPLFSAMFSSNTLDAAQEENIRKREQDYGVPRQVQSELSELTMKSMFTENTVGANSEALLCLKKGRGATWGACEDYKAYFERLYSNEQERLATASSDHLTTSRLRIRVYFAETDMMIGKQGQEYLNECFRGGSNGIAPDIVDFEAATIVGSDHDSIIGMVSVLETVFVQAGGHLPSN